MDKVNVSRINFRSSLLKQVVIRIDYSEVANFEGLIQKMTPLLKDFFAERSKYTTNNINVTINEKDLANDRVPIAVLPPNEVYRFSSSLIEPRQRMVLDVANTFSCIIINCDNYYDRIEKYVELMGKIMTQVFEYDAYLTIQRIAIRKIDGKNFDSLDDAKEIFENIERAEVGCPSMNVFQHKETSFIIEQASGIQVNLSRSYGVSEDKKYQVELDIDGYISISQILKTINNQEIVYNILMAINDRLFELFKLNVTEAFLNSGLIK